MTQPSLNSEEQQIMDQINAAYQGILKLGLSHNIEELTAAVHTTQQFVIQHMLYRLNPENWSNWYEKKAK